MLGGEDDVNDSNDTVRQVIEFVASERGYRPHRVHEHSDLYADLGLYGDDVDEFFEAFLERFEVPIVGLDLSGCFPGEGWWFCFPPTLFFKPTRRLLVKHLIEAAVTKRWPQLEGGPQE